jgi:hypothetical protein
VPGFAAANYRWDWHPLDGARVSTVGMAVATCEKRFDPESLLRREEKSQGAKSGSPVKSAPAQKTSESAPAAEASRASNGHVTDDQIRLRAYLKEQAAGSPEGDGAAFWLAAERELQTHTDQGKSA